MFHPAEDDDFFTPTSSSNLASLFSSSISSPNTSGVVLTYNAPKQPKPPTEEPSGKRVDKSKGQSSVVCAKPVSLYKLKDSYDLLGKYGLALIGTTWQADEIILYKDKRNILMRVKVTPSFEFILQNNKFLCFIDDSKQIWSMTFESAKDLNEFEQNIETCNIKIVHVKTETNSNIKQSDNTNNNGKAETEADVAVEENAEVVTRSPSSPKRADILSRMAKMGQSILPNTVLKSNLLSDSETDDSGTSTINLNRKSKTRKDIPTTKEKHTDNNTIGTPPTNVQSLIPMAQVIPSYTAPHVTQSLPSNVIMSTLPSTIDNLNLNVYMAESRLHNSEVRMNMSTITSKMDNILSEITKLKFPSDTDQLENDFLKAKINTLETKIIYLSKTLGEKENAKANELASLNDEVKLKDEVILQQNERYSQLERRLSDEIAQLKERSEKCKANEEELKKIVETQRIKLSDLEAMCEVGESKKDDLQKTIENLNEEVHHLNATLNDVRSEHRALQKAKIKSFSESTKQSMNAMYQNVLKDFSAVKPDNNIQNVLASSMKQATYEIIQHFRNCVTVDEGEDLNGTDSKKGAPPVPDF